jgi:hypothetical protein
MLKAIDQYQAMLPQERLKFRLERRLRSYLAVYGGLDRGLGEKVQEAFDSIQRDSSDARASVDQAISALKDGFV